MVTPGMDNCEKILHALLKMQCPNDASTLAIWLGDLCMEHDLHVRADGNYIIAYENSKVKHAKYNSFVNDQTQRFFLRPRGLRKEKGKEVKKPARIITAVVFRIK